MSFLFLQVNFHTSIGFCRWRTLKLRISPCVRDGPFEFLGGGGGGWVIFGETVFFFLLPENQDIFFRQVERQDIFFSDKVKAGFFFF